MKNEVNKEYTTHLRPMVQTELKEPSLYQVIMHNDDFTPMEFVVNILEKFFFMDRRRATMIMLEVHMRGKAACGAYTRDVAASKVMEIIDYARMNEHPLICSMEVA